MNNMNKNSIITNKGEFIYKTDEEYVRRIFSVAFELKKAGVPYTDNKILDGWQLRFPWCEGDIICHFGSYSNNAGCVESMGFPWDEGDCTAHTPEDMAHKIIKYYNEKEILKMKKYSFFTVITDNGEMNEYHERSAAEYPQVFYDTKENALRALLRCAQDTPKIELTESEKQFITCDPKHYGLFFEVINQEMYISEKLIDSLKANGKTVIHIIRWNNGDINEWEEDSEYPYCFATEKEAKAFFETHPQEFEGDKLWDGVRNPALENNFDYKPYCYLTQDVLRVDLEYGLDSCEIKDSQK